MKYKEKVFEELYRNVSHIKEMLSKGIQINEKTSREYFTGYSYNTLYDWDQYFEAIVQMYSGHTTERIINGIIIFLENQQDNGFIVRCVPPGIEEEKEEHVKPFLCQTAVLVYKKDKNLKWITEERYIKLKKYLDYWLNNLDKNNNHLSTWNSGPHCGMDNQHERAGHWGDRFCEGVDLNCYLYRECLAFSLISKIKGNFDEAERYEQIALNIKKAIQTELWVEEDGMFYDKDERSGEHIKVKYVGAFAPLWTGIATREQAEKLVKNHLINREEFWREYPIPALAATEPGYSETQIKGDVGCCWRANTWIPTNYYVFHGLMNYGYKEIASDVANKTYELVKKSGDREYYASETGNGCGLNPFWGWSLLAYFMPVEYEMNYDPTKLDIDVISFLQKREVEKDERD